MISLNALAAPKGKGTTAVIDTNSYNFRCVGPTLNLMLSSFSLPISRPATSAAMGAAAGKAATSSLTIEFPASAVYSTLYSQVIKGDHYSSCALVERVAVSAGAASSTEFTWTFSQVTPTNVTAIWKEASSTGSTGSDIPTAQVRVTLTFTEVRFEDGSGSSSKTAIDDWTATQ